MDQNTVWKLLQNQASSFKHSAWDVIDYQAVQDYSKRVRTMAERYTDTAGRDLVQDAFFALQGNDPDPTDRLGRAWEQVIRTEEFQNLRTMANRDRAGTAIASLKLAHVADQAIRDADAEASRKAQERDQRRKTVQESGQDPELVQEALEAIQTEEDADQGPEIVIPVAAIETAAEEVQNVSAFASSTGAGLPGTPGEKLDLALELGDLVDLSEFARLLGWTQRIVAAASRETRGGSDELTGYRLNGWTPNVLPQQMIAVADGDMTALAAFADGALTNRSYQTREPMGKGPVVLLRDESGSMIGSKHKKALAFELALADAFNRDGRELIVIAWAGATDGIRTYIYGQPGLDQHLRTFFDGDSTEPRHAFTEAVRLCEEYVSGADILCLTDGEFSAADQTALAIIQTLQPFKANEGRAWAVMIGQETDGVRRSFAGWTDGWIAINQIGAGDKIGAILGAMANRTSQGQTKRQVV